MNPFIILDKKDNVATALMELPAGFVMESSQLPVKVVCTQAIPKGHKVALVSLQAGDKAIKYGTPIGRMTRDAEAGSLVHVHNLTSCRGKEKAGG